MGSDVSEGNVDGLVASSSDRNLQLDKVATATASKNSSMDWLRRRTRRAHSFANLRYAARCSPFQPLSSVWLIEMTSVRKTRWIAMSSNRS